MNTKLELDKQNKNILNHLGELAFISHLNNIPLSENFFILQIGN